jgi:hypothetical protein
MPRREHAQEKYSNSDSECERKRSDSDDKKHSDSDSHEKCKCNFRHDYAEVYKYFKYLLETDDKLMVRGSPAFLTATNTLAEAIPQNFQISLQNIFLEYNVSHLLPDSPFTIRRTGIYIYFFVISTDQATQVTLFVNGEPLLLDRVGNNSGAGQLVLRGLVQLVDGDSIIIRNNLSSVAAVQSALNIGGSLIGNPSTFLIAMVATTVPAVPSPDFSLECLSKKELKHFRKLKYDYLDDNDLMLDGYRAKGSFYNVLAQNIPVSTDIVWENATATHSVELNTTIPSQINVMDDGYYKIIVILNVDLPSQFTLLINGSPMLNTTQGINKSGQLSIRTIQLLRKNDYITIRNYTSGTSINLVPIAGGTDNAQSANLTLFKIGSIDQSVPTPTYVLPCCKLKCYSKMYNRFRNYLLSQPDLMLSGTGAYLSIMSDTYQAIPLNAPVEWNINDINQSIQHINGTYESTIEISGYYDISFDIICNEAMQFAICVNGVAVPSAIGGRTSGAARMLLKQILLLNRGDIVTVENHTSNAGTITTSLNSGGNEVDKNRTLVLLLLSPLNKCVHRSMKCKYTTVSPAVHANITKTYEFS